jgi:hypothetical protein
VALTYALADFRADFPEFDDSLDAPVSAALARAKRYYDDDVFGAGLWQEAVGLKTALILTSSPKGFRARPTSATESQYSMRLAELIQAMPRKTLTIYPV